MLYTYLPAPTPWPSRTMCVPHTHTAHMEIPFEKEHIRALGFIDGDKDVPRPKPGAFL